MKFNHLMAAFCEVALATSLALFGLGALKENFSGAPVCADQFECEEVKH
jgi:hypothetical protein